MLANGDQSHKGNSLELLLKAERQFQLDIEKLDEYIQQIFLNEMNEAGEKNNGHLLAKWLEKKDAYEKLRVIDDSPELRILKKEVRMRLGLAVSRLKEGYNDSLLTAGNSGAFEEVRSVNAEWKRFFSRIDPNQSDGLQALRHCLLDKKEIPDNEADDDPALESWFINRCGVVVEGINVLVRYGPTLRTEKIFIAREIPHLESFQIKPNDQIVSVNKKVIDDERIKSPISFSFPTENTASMVIVVRELLNKPKTVYGQFGGGMGGGGMGGGFNKQKSKKPIKNDQEVFWGKVRTLVISVSGKAIQRKPETEKQNGSIGGGMFFIQPEKTTTE